MKRIFFLLACLSSKIFATTYYAAPTGNASNDGKSFAKAKSFAAALSLIKTGDSLLLQGGTYLIPYTSGVKNTFNFTASGQDGDPIYVGTLDNTRALFDFSTPPYEWVQNGYGFSVAGSYWYFKNIDITRASYQGAYVTGAHNTFFHCSFYLNRFSGIEINKGGSATSVINCDSYQNYNPKPISGVSGAAADGFAPKQTQGAGNVLMGCRAWENSDDGYDTFDSPEGVVIENCWSFNNGSLKVGDSTYSGNMDGFKLGGNSQVQHNEVYNCVSFGNGLRGYDENNNKGGVKVYNCLAYNNNANYMFTGTLNSGEQHDFRNNISLTEKTASNIKSTNKQVNNTWNSGFSVSKSDFKSLDLSLATIARNADGSIPETDLFRLKAGSKLIDAGTSTGRPYLGSHPDIGPFEFQDFTTDFTLSGNFTEGMVVFPTWVEEVVHVRFLSSYNAASVAIFSMEGILVHSEALEKGENDISCQDLKSGPYLVQVKNNGMSNVFRMVKR